MNNRQSILAFSMLFPLGAMAQSAITDSIKTQELNEIVVEAQLQSTSATVSTYIPTSKQKNSSPTATDLLNRMAIPQLSPGMGNSVTTNTGSHVDIYIDFLPASEQDLLGMRMADVKRVEYYDYPQDLRFQGSAHVINFIMQKYEYGGYLKATANEFFIANSGELNLYSKFQYKKMTYDLGVGGYYRNGSHDFNNTVETYRLPQSDGIIKQFERYSITDDAESRRRYFWPTFKALYRTDKISISNSIGATFDNYPKENTAGSVYYTPADFQQTDFTNVTNHRQNYITYEGNWNFILPHGNTINFAPYYSYSHSKQNSRYTEGQSSEYINNALDNTHKASGNLRYQHDFGKYGNLSLFTQGFYYNSKTKYSGTSSSDDRLTLFRLGPGVAYKYTSDKFFGSVGIGFTYDRTKTENITENNTHPWIDGSAQYSFNNKNSFNAEFHYSSQFPDLSVRSSAVIQSNPLMKYTGNPQLKPYKCYDFGISYLWLPNNKFNISAFAAGFIATNRFAYVYEANADGILRTVQQPMGKFIEGRYGINCTARLLNNNLVINGQLAHNIVRNEQPFDWTKSHLNWYLQSFYYLNQWHFGIQYQSNMSSAAGFINGIWESSKNAYSAIVGWGNSSWSFQTQITNPFRWNWRSGSSVMTSQNYDLVQRTFSSNRHCYINVSATYTFGFGKKINIGNEASQMSGAGNAILK
ncbi:MAG: hypothetical protein HDS07_02420 [Bacteroides sp.]|nr:hypothetical protein [Bacteroides sp.]